MTKYYVCLITKTDEEITQYRSKLKYIITITTIMIILFKNKQQTEIKLGVKTSLSVFIISYIIQSGNMQRHII